MKWSSVKKAFRNRTFFATVWRHVFLAWKSYKLYAPIAALHKVQRGKVVFVHFAGLGFADNPKYIAQKLHELKPEWTFVWLVSKDKCVDLSNFSEYIKVVELYSLAALREYATAQFWIEDSRKVYFPHKKKNQFYIQTWHGGLGPKNAEEQVAAMLGTQYVENAKKDSSLIDLCVSSTALLTDLYKNHFWYSGEILECGSPRNDIFFSDKDFSFVKEKLAVAGKKICLYAPTFRNDYSLSHYALDYALVRDALEKKFGGEWCLALRLHPNFPRDTISALPSFVVDATFYPDTQELLASSDCVVTDYSSVIYDFMLTKRPAFIFTTDLKDFTSRERALNFTLDSTPFGLAESNEELVHNISDFNSDDYVKRVEEFSERFKVNEHGTASNSVAEWIFQKAGCANGKR